MLQSDGAAKQVYTDADAKQVYTDADGNMVFAADSSLLEMTSFSFRGKGNRIYLGDSADVKGFIFTVRGSKNRVHIGNQTRLIGKVNIKGNHSLFQVGNQTTFQSVSAYLSEGCSIFIGDDCMFSARIELRTSDSHSIFDRNTGKRLNKPGNIMIGSHVWIGKEVILSKNVKVASNVVIGVKSFVNKSILEEYAIYAGSPAKLVKSDVGWCRELMPYDD